MTTQDVARTRRPRMDTAAPGCSQLNPESDQNEGTWAAHGDILIMYWNRRSTSRPRRRFGGGKGPGRSTSA